MANSAKVKVFISFSGEKSQEIAGILAKWLPRVVQLTDPYLSSEGLTKGSKWSTELARVLESVSIGLLCVTRDNLKAPWLMYEAGALAKSVSDSRVCPILFGVNSADLPGPLAQFQAANFTQLEVVRVLKMINGEIDAELRLSDEDLESAAEHWWTQLESEVLDVLEAEPSPALAERDQAEILVEILDLIRSVHRSVELFAG